MAIKQDTLFLGMTRPAQFWGTHWAALVANVIVTMYSFMFTEELWAHMVEHGEQRENLLALAQWPKLSGLTDAAVEEEIGWVVRLVSEIRSVRTEMNVPVAAKIPLALPGAGAALKERAKKHQDTISRLARLESITFPKAAPKGAAVIVVGDTSAALPLAGSVFAVAEELLGPHSNTSAQR